MDKTLNYARKISIPTKKDEIKIKKTTEELVQKINQHLIKKKINAEFVIGGSVGKGTWLPGKLDIDGFLKFNKTYNKKSVNLSDLTEKIIKKLFKNVQRLHGSRDYFQFKYNGYVVEIVPVVDIWKAKDAKNITDVSPLHINYVKIKTEGTDLKNEIRLLKQFMKSQGVYGAESYVSGFSGYVAELLCLYYRGFLQVVTHFANTSIEKEIIDPEKHYKNKKEILKNINKSKQQGPLILVDPIQKERNAAAAVDKKKYEQLQKSARLFLKKPTNEFFEITYLKLNDLVKNKNKRTLIALNAKPQNKKVDVDGAKLKSTFDYIKNQIVINDFQILEADWQWNKKDSALFWFYLDSKKLSKTKKHIGPMINQKEHLSAFKEKYKTKVKFAKNRAYVELNRHFRKIEELFALKLKKDPKLKNIKLIYLK